MGYTTAFEGTFTLDRPLTPDHAAYLKQFADTRRMKRDEQKIMTLLDPVRTAVGLPPGLEGGYFVGGTGFSGQDRDPSVVDYNKPPLTQPSLWCQWVPTEDGTGVEWDQGEKFYCYVEWLKYLVQHFLAPWGYVLNGEVHWRGEDRADVGTIHCSDNVVEAVKG